MTPRNRIQLHFDVATDDQAAELSAAWEEIVSGKRTRISTAAEDTHEIIERARTSLQVIVKAIEEHPGTGQTGRLVRFLAGVYNGNEFPFDSTDLRALDTELANACIDYLNYDRLAKAEVHTHLPNGGRQMEWFIAQQGIRRLLHARLLSESVAKPLCGPTDGPWSARGFAFLRLTCHDCQSLVLNPEHSPA